MAEKTKPKGSFETILTIMVAFAAVLAGLAGFFASSETRDANSARKEGFIALTNAQTNALMANQIILRDEQLLLQAEIAERNGDSAFAMELRSRTLAVQWGYFDLSGNATGGDRAQAIADFVEGLYTPVRANTTASDQAFAQAEREGQAAENFLLATILFAATAVLGSFATSAESPRWRRFLMIFTGAFFLIPVSVVLLTAFGVLI